MSVTDDTGICFGCSKPPLQCECEPDDDVEIPDQRIIDWIERELALAQIGDHNLVSMSDAYRIAFTACEKTLRVVGGL